MEYTNSSFWEKDKRKNRPNVFDVAVKISLSKNLTVTKYGQNLSHRTLKNYDKSIGTFFSIQELQACSLKISKKKYHLGKTCVFVLTRWWSNSYLLRGFKVLRCLQRDQILKKIALNLMWEIALLCMFRGLE